MNKNFVLVFILSLFLGLILAAGVMAENPLGPKSVDSLDVLISQPLGRVLPFNPVKYAIRTGVGFGIPTQTITLLLLLPLVAAFIAAARNLIGIKGFGIFLPAALAVTLVATGPILGIGLFLVIVSVSTLVRIVFRRLKFKLQYLPRMALILWFVVVSVLAILFSAPYFGVGSIANVSIFAVLILTLLAEDFTKVQLGKSIRTAVDLTSETLLLSLVSYLILTLRPVQEFAILNPEALLIGVFVFDFILGKYTGLRLLELWRFRKLISN